MTMKVYTKGGDKGQTSLLSGKRVAKNFSVIGAYGTIDELNTFVGLLHDSLADENLSGGVSFVVEREKLARVQYELFNVSTEVASLAKPAPRFQLLSLRDTKRLEEEIDTFTAELPALRNFVLPRGHRVASLAHVCRAVCRRAEREVCALIEENYEIRAEVVSYLNRLSDWFFTLSRHLLHRLGAKEETWRGKS